MRPGREDDTEESTRNGAFNLTPHESTNFSLSHKHSGIHGDGQRVPAGFINWESPIPDGAGPILTSPNGTQYRLGVDNDGALTTTPV